MLLTTTVCFYINSNLVVGIILVVLLFCSSGIFTPQLIGFCFLMEYAKTYLESSVTFTVCIHEGYFDGLPNAKMDSTYLRKLISAVLSSFPDLNIAFGLNVHNSLFYLLILYSTFVLQVWRTSSEGNE